MVLRWVLALGAASWPFDWFSACSGGSVVSPALSSSAKEPQLKQHSNVQCFVLFCFFQVLEQDVVLQSIDRAIEAVHNAAMKNGGKYNLEQRDVLQ